MICRAGELAGGVCGFFFARGVRVTREGHASLEGSPEIRTS